MSINRKLKVSVILFAILYCLIGILDFVWGASQDSRFYFFDNLFIKTTGLILVICSVGLLFKKEIARKGLIVILCISVLEIFIGIPNTFSMNYIGTAIFELLVLAPGIYYFSRSSSRQYFIKKNDD